MAAVRNHHVMVLMSHVGGSDWMVHDGNSGGGLTRDHVRSINGYIIVDPNTSLICKPYFYLVAVDRLLARDCIQERGKVFLKVSIALASDGGF